jgi:hypothetical protein
VTTTSKILGAAKPRDEIAPNSFDLNEERFLAAEKAIGSHPNNSVLRSELLSAFYQYQGLSSLWRQAPTMGALLDECNDVLRRLKKGAVLFSVLNSRPQERGPRKKEQNTKQKAVALNAGISGELLNYLIHREVDPESPNLEKVMTALTDLKDTPRKKTGRPEEYARNGLLLELIKIYERETGKLATSSSNDSRANGHFMDLCRAMMIPSHSFMDADGLAIEKALNRIKKLL